jgi:formate/nitrite transporter FocA (FNT family)
VGETSAAPRIPSVGLRDIGYGEVAGNFAIASVGNIIGGVLLVTLSRFSQARAASRYVGALGD